MGAPVEVLSSIQEKRSRVAVIGLGYVGLPMALEAASAGFRVTGLDVNAKVVESLNGGTPTTMDVSAERLNGHLRSGQFKATTDTSELAEADVIVICVPTPLTDEQPDTSYITSAGSAVAKTLRQGQLVILESTTYPGTTEELLLGLLEESGLKAGVNFYLGFSPERIDPGNQQYDVANLPKVVGGIDEQSSELMQAFYGTFIDKIVVVSSAKTAEMTKLLENTYRHVNIALANEMAILCHDMGVDIWEVIDAAATKPFGFQPFYPGPGWGGHCIPVDPAYLSWRVRQMGATARFVDLAREFNERMPGYVVQRMTEVLNDIGRSVKSSSILILGVAYKADVADLRESPAIEIIERANKAGASVSFHDFHVQTVNAGNKRLESVELNQDTLKAADLVLVHTAHTAYDGAWIAEHSRLILDTRNALAGHKGRIVKL